MGDLEAAASCASQDQLIKTIPRKPSHKTCKIKIMTRMTRYTEEIRRTPSADKRQPSSLRMQIDDEGRKRILGVDETAKTKWIDYAGSWKKE